VIKQYGVGSLIYYVVAENVCLQFLPMLEILSHLGIYYNSEFDTVYKLFAWKIS